MTAPASPPARDDALATFVQQLLGVTGVTASIIDHMTAWAAAGRAAPDALPMPEVLTDLLCSALGPLRENHSTTALETTAVLLAEAVELIVAEVLLVPLSPPACTSGFGRLPTRRRPSASGGHEPPHPP